MQGSLPPKKKYRVPKFQSKDRYNAMNTVPRRESVCKVAIGRVFIEQLEIVCEEKSKVKWSDELIF